MAINGITVDGISEVEGAYWVHFNRGGRKATVGFRKGSYHTIGGQNCTNYEITICREVLHAWELLVRHGIIQEVKDEH